MATALLAVGFAVLAGARAARPDAVPAAHHGTVPRGRARPAAASSWLPVLVVGACWPAARVGRRCCPRVLGGVLDLTAFTGGFAVRPALDPAVAAAVAGLVLVAMVAALGLEQLVNRRLRLGDVLRLGEEMS